MKKNDCGPGYIDNLTEKERACAAEVVLRLQDKAIRKFRIHIISAMLFIAAMTAVCVLFSAVLRTPLPMTFIIIPLTLSVKHIYAAHKDKRRWFAFKTAKAEIISFELKQDSHGSVTEYTLKGQLPFEYAPFSMPIGKDEYLKLENKTEAVIVNFPRLEAVQSKAISRINKNNIEPLRKYILVFTEEKREIFEQKNKSRI